MAWVLVGLDAVDAWRDREHDDEVRATVLQWLLGFTEGPGFADGVPSLALDGLFVARVPGTTVIVTYLVLPRLDPPAVAIREIG
jgi:hypothetical protein